MTRRNVNNLPRTLWLGTRSRIPAGGGVGYTAHTTVSAPGAGDHCQPARRPPADRRLSTSWLKTLLKERWEAFLEELPHKHREWWMCGSSDVWMISSQLVALFWVGLGLALLEGIRPFEAFKLGAMPSSFSASCLWLRVWVLSLLFHTQYLQSTFVGPNLPES